MTAAGEPTEGLRSTPPVYVVDLSCSGKLCWVVDSQSKRRESREEGFGEGARKNLCHYHESH